jgi:hypothetical protein
MRARMEKTGYGMEKIRIRDKHPGSATLLKIPEKSVFWEKLFFVKFLLMSNVHF